MARRETREGAFGPIAALIALWSTRGLLQAGIAPQERALWFAVPLAMLWLMLSSLRRSGAGWAGCALLADLAFTAASIEDVALSHMAPSLFAIACWNVVEIEDRRLCTTGRHHPAFLALPLIQMAWIHVGGQQAIGAVVVLAYALDVVAGSLIGGRHLFAGVGRAGKGGIAIVAAVAIVVCILAVAAPSGLGIAVDPPGIAGLARGHPAWIAAAAILAVSVIRGSPVRAWRATASVLFMAIGTLDERFLPCFALAGPLTAASCWGRRTGPDWRRPLSAILDPWPAAAMTVAIAIGVMGAGMRSGGW